MFETSRPLTTRLKVANCRRGVASSRARAWILNEPGGTAGKTNVPSVSTRLLIVTPSTTRLFSCGVKITAPPMSGAPVPLTMRPLTAAVSTGWSVRSIRRGSLGGAMPTACASAAAIAFG